MTILLYFCFKINPLASQEEFGIVVHKNDSREYIDYEYRLHILLYELLSSTKNSEMM